MNPLTSLFDRLRRSMFDVAGPSSSTSAPATVRSICWTIWGGRPERERHGLGRVSGAGTENGTSRHCSPVFVQRTGTRRGRDPRGLECLEATLPQVSQAVVGREVAPVTADAQQGESISADRPLSERHIGDRRQSSGRTTDAVPPTGNTGNAIARHPAVVPTGAEPPPPPPPPPIEVPTPLTPMTVGRAPVDLAASAAMAKDILAANEEQPPLQPRRDARPPTPADGSAASTPDVPGAERSGGHADEELGSEAAGDDAPATPDFFASTRGKKRFRRE